jgi:hypothetical protein
MDIQAVSVPGDPLQKKGAYQPGTNSDFKPLDGVTDVRDMFPELRSAYEQWGFPLDERRVRAVLHVFSSKEPRALLVSDKTM